MQDIQLTLLKSRILCGLADKTNCAEEIKSFFLQSIAEDEENIEDYKRLDVLFDMFYGIFKDSYNYKLDIEYKEYIYNLLVDVFNENNTYMAEICANFLHIYFSLIDTEDETTLLEDKIEGLNTVNIDMLPNDSVIKRTYYATYLNILISQTPINKNKIQEICEKLENCINA